MRSALAAGLAIVLPGAASPVQAQVIDPFALALDAPERAYGCASYLNAYSAMGQATDPKNPINLPLLLAYVASSVEAERQGASSGATSHDVRERMSAWDKAIVAATLSRLSRADRARMKDNFHTCVKVASELPAFQATVDTK